MDSIEICKGIKHDGKKPDWSLVDLSVLNGMVGTLTHYKDIRGRNNWQAVENAEQRFYAALIRHMSEFISQKENNIEIPMPTDNYYPNINYLANVDNEESDPFTSLDHALCCIYFLKWIEHQKQREKKNE